MKSPTSFRTTSLARAALGASLLALVGCSGTRHAYQIISHPDGAAIFVDEVEKGRSNEQKLLVDFSARSARTLRLEKPGYQTTGVILTPNSPRRLEIFLQEAPESAKVLKRLERLEVKLDEAIEQLGTLQAE